MARIYTNVTDAGLLIRLRDPFVAQFVRRLVLSVRFLRTLQQKIELSQSWKRRFLHLLPTLLTFGDSEKLLLVLVLRLAGTADRNVNSIVGDILKGLNNLKDYTLQDADFHSAFDPRLRNLAGGSWDRLESLSLQGLASEILEGSGRLWFCPKDCGSPPGPEKLQIKFLTPRHFVVRTEHENVMTAYLAPAINSMQHCLHTLILSLAGGINLAPLFGAVFLPHLSTLSVTIPYGNPYLGDPSIFRSFLERHDTSLKELDLRTEMLLNNYLDTFDDQLNSWITRALDNIQLRKLQKLEIGRQFDSTSLSVIVAHLSRSLTEISLLGVHYDDVGTVLDSYTSHRPKHTSLGSFRLKNAILTPQLVDILSERLPLIRLQMLELQFNGFRPFWPNRTRRLPVSKDIVHDMCIFFFKRASTYSPAWQIPRLTLSFNRQTVVLAGHALEECEKLCGAGLDENPCISRISR
ncbi:hypothetical protein AX17_002796 [Amanita inopinata Kibby_2008]|nr:hypothetical protein AX17_002796 [Amanita inopinata Kibby_2008]